MTMEPQGEPLKFAFRIDEAAKATGLGRSFLYERMASGELKSVKICGRRLILREDLIAFLHQKTAGPIAAPIVQKPKVREARQAKDGAKARKLSGGTSAQLELPLK
jgi:excisionase family DNA binding protein